MKEWICEEVPAVTIDGRIVSTMLHQTNELVRCKDCIKVDVCCRRGTDNPDWFCADGERKEDR